VSSQIGASTRTPKSKRSGASELCQDTTHARIPNVTSSTPNLLAGRRIHQ
jgi:hypothetical protein